MISQRVDSIRGGRLLLAVCCIGLGLAAASRLRAGSPESDTTDEERSAVPSGEGKETTVDPILRRKTIWQAFLMLGGIIVGGTLLLLIVVMWGNRTRRFARHPLPSVAKRDELWFLKPKPAAGAAQPDDGKPGEETSV